jgi:phage terminase large subunit GpA-like protein
MLNLNLLKGLFDGMKPTEIITVSQWAEKYRYLSSEASFLGGSLYSCTVTPYTRKIMDCLSVYSPYQEIVFCKSSQTGGTEIGNNWIGYIMHIAPGPMLMLMPTDGTVERNSKVRIDPMISHCKELSERVSPKKSRDGDNTINQKRFPGGVLYMGGSNSPAVLKSIPVRYVMLDEVDEYQSDLSGQGNADALAKVRTRMFPNRKIYYVSTPTIEGYSLIQKKFLETDQNYFEVPCPFCGGFQRLKFEQLKWEVGKEDEVKYQCIHCDELIDESYKSDMLLSGQWEPSNKDNINSRKIGFHINSLYAPSMFYSWSNIIESYQLAEKDPNEMKVFINTILGETYAEKGEAPRFENLYNRRESYELNKVPASICFLTCGADVQKDRIELEIVGWCKDKRSYSIDYRVLNGNTSLPEVWDELEKVVYETWTREDGTELNIRLMTVDSGYNTTEVYAWVRKFPVTKVVPIKGNDKLGMAVSAPRAIDINKRGKKIGKVKVWNIGVSYLKHELYSWLGLEKYNEIPPPCYCHFPQYDQHYFQSLTAEDWIPSKKIWKTRYKRNEALDTRIYARAASVIVGLDRLKPHQIEALSGNPPVQKTLSFSENSPEKPKNKTEKRKNTESIW